MRLEWTGVMPAITTCFDENLQIDHEFTARHVKWLVENGCTGIVTNGSGATALKALSTGGIGGQGTDYDNPFLGIGGSGDGGNGGSAGASLPHGIQPQPGSASSASSSARPRNRRSMLRSPSAGRRRGRACAGSGSASSSRKAC